MAKILKKNQLGFTIIEMVVAIVISGILAIGIVSFIGDSVNSLTTSSNRNQIATSGRVALDRLAMEIHNALPNSIRATTATAGGDQCLEFVPVRAATTYINPSFSSGGTTTFDVVDLVPSQHGVSGGYAVIYPNSQSRLYDGDNGASAGWPNFPSNRRPIQEIASIVASASPNQSTVTLVTSHRFRQRSPSQRFFIVEDPVSFCVVGENLYRYTNYGFYTAQVTAEEQSGVCEVALDQTCLPNYAAAPSKMLITNDLDNTGLTAFTVSAQTLRRNSLVAFQFNFTANGDSILLNHEVLTRSVP
jgi:MSHA biogenesis protein MshO